MDAHCVAVSNNIVIGVIGWYQDNVHYADKAMGDKFPDEEAYWVGFFAVGKEHQGKESEHTLGLICSRNKKLLQVQRF